MELEISRAEPVSEQGQKVLGMRYLDVSAEACAEAFVEIFAEALSAGGVFSMKCAEVDVFSGAGLAVGAQLAVQMGDGDEKACSVEMDVQDVLGMLMVVQKVQEASAAMSRVFWRREWEKKS